MWSLCAKAGLQMLGRFRGVALRTRLATVYGERLYHAIITTIRQSIPPQPVSFSMKSLTQPPPLQDQPQTSKAQPLFLPILAWLTAALAGIIAPVASLIWLASSTSAQSPAIAPTIHAAITGAAGPILALGLMGAGMIGAAAALSFWRGIALSLLSGACLLALALGLGMPPVAHGFGIGLAFIIAGLSFAARGALFARSGLGKGWIIAVFVVAGEAAILVTAYAMPGQLPDWLLVLLPAQWANMAFQTAITGESMLAAAAPLLALTGTAAATLFVARLWPKRWPYLIMFTSWIGLSALVYHTAI